MVLRVRGVAKDGQPRRPPMLASQRMVLPR
jgi:hypothetical protein